MKRTISQSLMTSILNGISIVALIFLVVSLFSYGRANNALNTANEQRFDLTYNANRFMNGSAYLTNEVRAYAATANQEHYDNYWNEVNNLKNRDKGVAAMQEIGITSEEQKMIDDMYALSNQLVPLEEEAMKNVQAGERVAAFDYVYGEEYSNAIAKINALKEQFLSALNTRTLAQVDYLIKQTNQIRIEMIVVFIIVAIMQFSNMLYIQAKVLRPVRIVKGQMLEISKGNLSTQFDLQSDTSEIGRLVDSIHETKRELKKYISDIDAKLTQMAQGNMDLTIDSDYRGEFLPIQSAMRQILEALNGALLKINVTSEQVAEESDRVAMGSHRLSSGTVQQAAAVEELSASIQEISKEVNSTSADAEDARKASMSAMTHLMTCNEKMEALKAAIEDISTSSRQIGGITKTIEDISFQTNILALNASVEAARAGEAGKGFAVVADEVQSLANKSSDSAKNIAELIENSIKLVQSGASLSVDTMEALTHVIAGGQQSTELVDRIAESAMQQAQSLAQVTEGMRQISDVVQSNAATAQESAASAEELQNHAKDLKISVQKFRLRGNGH